MKLFLTIGLLVGLSFSSGCLRTRAELGSTQEAQALKDQVKTLEQVQADKQIRFEEVNLQIREVVGRIEVLERKLELDKQERKLGNEKNKSEARTSEERFRLFEQALTKLELEVQKVSASVTALAAAQKVSAAAPAKQAHKSTYDIAKESFNKKDWKSAVVEFEDYRKRNPKGNRYAEVTYLMGVCMQELKEAAGAKAYFNEVVKSFPKSSYSKKAQYRLTKIK